MLGWGLQTILHAVSLAALETDVEILGEDRQNPGVADRARADVQRLKHEALDEIGSPMTYARFGPAIIRRVFAFCDEYRGNGATRG